MVKIQKLLNEKHACPNMELETSWCKDEQGWQLAFVIPEDIRLLKQSLLWRGWLCDNCSFLANNRYLTTPASPYLFTIWVGEL